MSFRRVSLLAAVALATLLWMSCGDIYRPVVIPINITPPNSANFHAVFGLSANVPYNQGTALQIDVSGDSNIGVANMGVNPTHAAVLPGNSQVFVASAGSLFAGDSDIVTSFVPASDSTTAVGLGTPTIYSFPNVGAGQTQSITSISETGSVATVTLNVAISNAVVGAVITIAGVNVAGYNGNFVITSVGGTPSGTSISYTDPTAGLAAASGGTATVPVTCSYLPDFVASSQNSAVYVANYGVENGANCNLASTDSVAQINPLTTIISNIGYLGAGSHPVAMAETQDGLNLYVLNQGNNTVTDLSPTDLSTLATIPVGNTPAWAAMRVDGQRLYVITQGDGELYTINSATNAVVSGSPQSVGGAGANYALYDTSRNRLYVTNPNAGAVYVFDATTDPPTPLGNASGAFAIPRPPIPANTPPCTGTPCSFSSVMPVSVAVLPDTSRFYVASYVTPVPGSPCPDPNVRAAGCVIPQVTVFDAGSFRVKTTVFPLLTPVVAPASNIQPFALAPVAFCAPVFPYTPASARFRMSAAAAADSTHVYASMCDGGSVAIIHTTPSSIATTQNNSTDTLATDLPAPFSAAPAPPGGEPPLQNPLLLLTGQ